MWNNDSLVEDLHICAEELSYESQARIAAIMSMRESLW